MERSVERGTVRSSDWRRREGFGTPEETESVTKGRTDPSDHAPLKSFCTTQLDATKIRRGRRTRGKNFCSRCQGERPPFRNGERTESNVREDESFPRRIDGQRIRTGEEVEAISGHARKGSPSLSIGEVRIRTTPRYRVAPIGPADVTEREDDTRRGGRGRVGTPVRRRRSWEPIRPFGKAVRNGAQRARLENARRLRRSDGAASRTVPPREILKTGKRNIYSSTLRGGQNLEIEGMPILWGAAGSTMVHERYGTRPCRKR